MASSSSPPVTKTCFTANPVLHCRPPSPPPPFPIHGPFLLITVFLSYLLFRRFAHRFLLDRLDGEVPIPLLKEDHHLPSNSLKWVSLIESGGDLQLVPCTHPLELLPANSIERGGALIGPGGESGGDSGGESGGKRRKRKVRKNKNRKKKKEGGEVRSGDVDGDGEGLGLGFEGGMGRKEEDLYPFTSSSSATQRRIKQQYDQLVKSHDSKKLTLEEVGEFVNCLVDARTELQQKSEIIQRKFTIKKALLLRADRSSFDRLQKQLNKLELEQKRLEEDTLVYNRLQHQLKRSPAYQKLLDIGASEEIKAKSADMEENADEDFTEISFEELLEQEKKDSFWQKRARLRSPPT